MPQTAGVVLRILVLLAFSPGWSAPKPAIPKAIREVWLRYHELELCQSLDAVFSFHRDGVEVWVLYEEERNYQKLVDLLNPLRPSLTVEIYPTKYTPEKKGRDENVPPPSLWNNSELRKYFQDPLSRNTPPLSSGQSPVSGEGDSEYFLKQRMMIFASQTLDWNRRLRRYAADLPDLAAAGFDRDAQADLKPRAAEACRSHVESLDRIAERIQANMSTAIPRPAKREKTEAVSGSRAPTDPATAARQLASSAQALCRRIQQFVFPRRHTVDVGDLKEPGMLESIRNLRQSAAGFLASSAPR